MNTYADDLAALVEALDGKCSTLKEQINAEWLAFLRLSRQASA
jgi:hypothetical protein